MLSSSSGRLRAATGAVALVSLTLPLVTTAPAQAASAKKAGATCSKAGRHAVSANGVGLVCGSNRRWATDVLPTVAPTTLAPPPLAPAAVPTKNLTSGCATGNTTGDQFPEKAKIVEAKGLSITYHDTYKVVKVTNPWRGAKSGFTYVFAQCGTKAPALTGDLAGASVITVPITSASIMTTTLAPEFDVLGAADKIASVDTASYYSTPSVVKRIESGAIKATNSGAKANVELLVTLKPSVVLTYGLGFGSSDGIDKLIDAGLPALVEASYMEETPLGRSEWVKLIGALTNQEAKAETEFAKWRTDYNALVAKVAKVKQRPVVIAGSMFEGTWYMPGGKSFNAQFIRDAGGTYPWASDSSTGSLALDFETVLDKAFDATYWINAGYLWDTMAAPLAEDTRYAKLTSYKAGNVYGNDKRVNATGGSDYFETAVVRPDLVLADLVSVLHPEVLPGHQTVWARHIPQG